MLYNRFIFRKLALKLFDSFLFMRKSLFALYWKSVSRQNWVKVSGRNDMWYPPLCWNFSSGFYILFLWESFNFGVNFIWLPRNHHNRHCILNRILSFSSHEYIEELTAGSDGQTLRSPAGSDTHKKSTSLAGDRTRVLWMPATGIRKTLVLTPLRCIFVCLIQLSVVLYICRRKEREID